MWLCLWSCTGSKPSRGTIGRCITLSLAALLGKLDFCLFSILVCSRDRLFIPEPEIKSADYDADSEYGERS